MSAELTARLEAVVARLEQYASGLAASAPSGGGGGGAAAERRKSPKLQDFEEYQTKFVEPFIAATSKFPELEAIGKQARIVFSRFADVIDAESVSKKPTNEELVKFLDPVVKVMQSADKAASDNRSAFFNQNKAWAEATQAFAWPTMAGGARQHVSDTIESADFYINKVLTKAKQDGGPKEKDAASFGITLKAMLKELVEYLGQSYRAGLEWNAKGAALSAFVPAAGGAAAASSGGDGGGVPPPPGPPPDLSSLPPPPGPPPPSGSFAPVAGAKPAASGGEAGMSAVFDAIRQSTTGGLKKVTDDMKTHKNPNLRAANTVPDKAPAPAASSSSSSSAKAGEKPLGPPTKEKRKGTWFVENFTSGQIDLPDVEIKEAVYITRCSNCTVKISNKIKSIAIDNCKRVVVEFDQVLSIFECVNSQNCKIECSNIVPAVQIDKSNGISVILLSRAGVAACPGIVTSNVSELNLVVPGKTDEDDPVEIPLPEQYITKYKDGKLITTPSDI